MNEHYDTVVIGGGQAGLAMGYHLRQRGLECVVLDQNQRVGDAWRTRWDSLHLFTPAPYNGLPGMKFPGPSSLYPSKDEAADYLEAYAHAFSLPVRTGTKVEKVTRLGKMFHVLSGENSYSARNLVVATGGFSQPRIPSFAEDLDPLTVNLHSSEYRNPAQMREGAVLVVGAGNSGAEIALDVAAEHEVWLSGRETGHEPTRAGTIPDRLFTPILWLAATRMTTKTPMGRKLRDHFLDPPRGIPLGRLRMKDLINAGVHRAGRTVAVKEGKPVVEDGQILDVSNVVWATGFAPDFGWIDLQIPLHNGYPVQNRGIVDPVPGLYFVGLAFLYSLSSALLGGVGRDAGYIADHIAARDAERTTAGTVGASRP